jgi:hypothetical protein
MTEDRACVRNRRSAARLSLSAPRLLDYVSIDLCCSCWLPVSALAGEQRTASSGGQCTRDCSDPVIARTAVLTLFEAAVRCVRAESADQCCCCCCCGCVLARGCMDAITSSRASSGDMYCIARASAPRTCRSRQPPWTASASLRDGKRVGRCCASVSLLV